VHNNKTIELLKHLSPSEVELFDQFLNTNFFSRKKKAALLFKYLKKFAPEYNSEKLNEANCYNYVFKNEPSTNILEIKKKLKNPFYDLKRLFVRFILIREMEFDTLERDFLLLNALKKRNIDSMYLNSISELQKKVEIDESGNLFQQYLRFGLQDTLYTNEAYKQNLNAEQESNLLETLLQHLDDFYLENKYRYSLHATLREQLIDRTVNNRLIDLLNTVDSEELVKNNATINLYQQLIAYLNKKENSIEEIQQLFINNFKHLSLISKQDIGITLLNAWMTLHREGREDALKMLFNLYQKTLELSEQVWFENQYFDVTHFRNIVVVSSALNELDWTESFINKYGNQLPLKLREDVIGMSKAQLFKNKGDYQKVIDCLNQIEFNDWIDQVTSKSLMMQCYYELKEWNSLSYYLESFEKFLRRNKTIPTEVKRGHLNYISFCKRLVNAQGKSIEKIDSLSKKLESTKNISGRIWLNQKLKELY